MPLSLISGLLGQTGSGGDAAALQAQANREAIAQIQKQFDITQENVQPFIGAGQQALPEVQRGAGIGGFGERLGELFGGGALQPLIDERTRAVQNQLAAGGLTRSGTGLREIADIPTQLGLGLENMLFGRQQGLSQQGLGAGLGLGQIGGQAAGQQAGLLQGIGQAQSQGSLLNAQQRAAKNQQFIQGFGELANLGGQFFPTGGGIAEAGGVGGAASAIGPSLVGGGGAASAGSIAGMFFSDPRLKDNMEEIGEIGDLKVYRWDWKPETKGTLVELCGTIGFMYDEVKKLYPQFVDTFGGFGVIFYERLLNHLEVKYA